MIGIAWEEADFPQNRSCYLLNYWTPPADVTFGWAFPWGTSVFIFSHLERSSHKLLPQMCLLTIFQSCSFSPWPFCPSIGHSPWISEQSHVWPFLLSNKYMIRCTAQSSTHGENYPSLESCGIVPEYRYSSPLLGGACITYRTVSNPGPSLLFPSQSITGHILGGLFPVIYFP